MKTYTTDLTLSVRALIADAIRQNDDCPCNGEICTECEMPCRQCVCEATERMYQMLQIVRGLSGSSEE